MAFSLVGTDITLCMELIERIFFRFRKFLFNKSSFRSPNKIKLLEMSNAFSILTLKLLKNAESAVVGL